MFKSYMKASLHLWRKSWLGVSIAFLGLIFAFSIVSVIAVYLYDNIRSDSWIPDNDKIYRVTTDSLFNGQPLFSLSSLSHGFVAKQLPDSFQEIETTTQLYNVDVTSNYKDIAESATISFVHQNFFEFFPATVIAGNLEAALNAPHGLILTRSHATAIYGSDLSAVIGTVVPMSWRNSAGEEGTREKKIDFAIRAIIDDLPENTHLAYKQLAVFNEGDTPDFNLAWPQVYTYFKVRGDVHETGLKLLKDDFQNRLEDLIPPSATLQSTLSFEPILGAQFFSETSNGLKTGVSERYTAGLITISLLLLATAALNFVNIFTALNSLRGREVAIRRILGGRSQMLIGLAMFEGAFVAVIAAFLGYLAAYDVTVIFADILAAEIDVFAFEHAGVFSGLMITAAGIGCLTALLPAIKFMGVKPESLMRDNQGAVAGGRGRMRQVFVGLQAFVMTITILAALQIWFQVDHLINFDRGFKTDNLLKIEAAGKENTAAFRGGFMEAVKQTPGVKGVTVARSVPFDFSTYFVPFAHIETGDLKNMPTSSVGVDYFDLLGVKLIAKLEEDWSVIENPIVLNEHTAKKLGFADGLSALGQSIFRRIDYDDGRVKDAEYRIVGIAPHIGEGFAGFMRQRIYELSVSESFDNAGLLVQVEETTSGTPLPEIEKIWRDMFPDHAFEVSWLQDNLRETFASDRSLAETISAIAMIAFVLASSGLYGMASHWLSTRRRELALRRVMGASKGETSKHALYNMIIPVLIGALLGMPTLWYLSSLWLEGYQSRAPLSPVIYGAVLVAILAYAVVSLLGHIYAALNEHPAKVLYHE
ncbi:FtsX-like permease family protein [Kordiimonas sp. SCSIO 12610]|uniref:FtsX-like permease family protein n=1 Tax=Kordiimonas sp. SCSIO 12610 TaxID=2829597 RepID=UPI0021088CB5|nr:FtsX-like permease family protein [Kordiimonas sp. SCSIO 12610]UTW56022.1 hypothetical protein KFF44_03770 [Kordiimonas sp. SCSIO 12610]